jgi:hypothetical protein
MRLRMGPRRARLVLAGGLLLAVGALVAASVGAAESPVGPGTAESYAVLAAPA